MSRPHYYILVGRDVIPAISVMTWVRWFNEADRTVARTDLGYALVSTVFLGLDHNILGEGPPKLFETLVFGGPLDGEMVRYSTWDEAVEGHDAMLNRVRSNNDDRSLSSLGYLPRR